MEKRVNIYETEPTGYKALLGLESYLATTSISKTTKELIKIRASQINGCAFCINMHTTDARKHGETEKRIYLLNAWKEVENLYTDEERVVLALTEEITLIASGGVSDATYKKAQTMFNDTEIAQIIMAIIAINAWNRLAIATQLQPA
ncbi:carboxymuconolactone decarboxylase family protein [Pedobacter namyangjuensis]|uniref:carboxymuconolactone decarboxylase family protein n=1 Tax=Pedobacter namyangjuensis TaxID=600626 RepID=UPI000DE55F7A|nr:carboxymuconolactone decarboxylase family protein [Pedobacter namyangjuensis]